MQERRNSAATLRTLSESEYVVLKESEYMLAFFAEGAKAYWRMWGPVGALMVQAVAAGAKAQHDYFQQMRQLSGAKSYTELQSASK